MVESTSFLKKLEFDKFYKIIIAVSATVLIFSIFLPTIGISNQQIQIISFLGLIYGTMAWLLDETQPKTIKPLNWAIDYRGRQLVLLLVFSIIAYFVYI